MDNDLGLSNLRLLDVLFPFQVWVEGALDNEDVSQQRFSGRNKDPIPGVHMHVAKARGLCLVLSRNLQLECAVL